VNAQPDARAGRAGAGVILFGPFSLNSATRQLLRDGREQPLSPKALQLLLSLTVKRDRAVSKGELQQELWPSTFVAETNLASLVAEIRRALDDDASDPRVIRTVHRFGYRFVAQVEESASPSAAAVPPVVKHWLVWDARRVPLVEGVNLIGRAADASVWVDAPGVSRQHAQVVIENDNAILEDLGSKNGTYVAGTRVTAPRQLVDGDQIRLGSVVVTFRVPEFSGATETAP
jgi:DNA-binding winged helix-turn-helix (wHTH) protein